MKQYLPTKHSYSSAVKAGEFIFLGLHRGKGEDFETQMKNAIRDIEKSLHHFGFDLVDIVKINVYLKSIENLGEMERYFKDVFEEGHYPARMTTTTEFCDDDCLLMLDGVAWQSQTQ